MILFLFLPEVNYEEIQLPWIQTGLISLNKIIIIKLKLYFDSIIYYLILVSNKNETPTRWGV